MNLADISGRPMVMLGGDFVHLHRVTGSIVSEFKWHEGEPVMIIYRASAKAKTGAYMIELKDAHQYTLSNGAPTAQLLNRFAREACIAIGWENLNQDEVFGVIDVIRDGMADLLAMPPEPRALEEANRPVAEGDELSIKLDGKTLIEVLV